MQSNIQEFFDDFSDHYNQEAFNDSLGLGYLDRIETQFISEAVSNVKIKSLLEIGFGAGRNLSLFKGRKIKMFGVDISGKMLSQTKRGFRGEDVTLQQLDAQTGLPYSNSRFDLIICIRVLKYMKKWPFVISEISRCLKRDGLTIIEVPNLFSIHFFGLIFANYFLFFIPNFLSVIEKNHLKVVSIQKGALWPFLVYKRTNNKKMLHFLMEFDRIINKILPVGIFSRNYVFLLQKY